MENNEKWCISLNGEDWESSYFFDAKQEAIDAARRAYRYILASNSECDYFDTLGGCLEDYQDGTFYVGQVCECRPQIDTGYVIDRLRDDAFDNLGDAAGNFLDNVSAREEDELQELLQAVVDKWLDEYDLRPSGYMIENTDEIYFAEVDQ